MPSNKGRSLRFIRNRSRTLPRDTRVARKAALVFADNSSIMPTTTLSKAMVVPMPYMSQRLKKCLPCPDIGHGTNDDGRQVVVIIECEREGYMRSSKRGNLYF
jgi:hypothetical protein